MMSKKHLTRRNVSHIVRGQDNFGKITFFKVLKSILVFDRVCG